MIKKQEAIKLKLKLAEALMSEVKTQIQNKFYNTAINRLYYSCFHATKALLLTKEFAPKTHKGVATLLHQEFVQKGLFDAQKASFFSTLMNERKESDYGDFLILDEEDIGEFIQPAKEYIEYISTLIEDYFTVQNEKDNIE